MKPLTLEQIAGLCQGHLNQVARSCEPSTLVTGITVDSRSVQPGDLFVAIRGERVDGHDFIHGAADSGAVVSLVEQDCLDQACIVVDDVVAALGSLASGYRREFLRAKVVGITGSSGKTTTKDLVAQVLDGSVVAAHGSFNTEVGLPLTMLRADEETDFLVLEMGMRGLGHIAYLCEIAAPDVAAVLNVGSAHLGMMSSREDIARAKGEIVEGLRPDAWAVLNADDPAVRAMRDRTLGQVVTFGEALDSDVRASDVRLDDKGRPQFVLHLPGADPIPISLGMHGEHFISAALASAAIAHVLGTPAERIAQNLSSARPQSPWRMEVHETEDGLTVINDAYNANPESVRAALKALRAMQGAGRSWAVLGEMRELGESAVDEHDAIGRLAVRLDISRLICVGEGTKVMHLGASNEGSWGDESIWVPDAESALALLNDQLEPGDVVLVKASRAIGLESVVTALLADRQAIA